MIYGERHLSRRVALVAALVGLALMPAAAGAAAVVATPASPWPGASVRLELSGFTPNARGLAHLTGAPPVRLRADRLGRAKVVVRLAASARRGSRGLRVRAGRRSVFTTLFVESSRRASSTMVALSGGRRVSLSPSSGPVASRMTIKASGFRPGLTINMRFAGRKLASRQTDDEGELTVVASVPTIGLGARIVRVKSGPTDVGLRYFVISPVAGSSASPTDPGAGGDAPPAGGPPPPPPAAGPDRTAPKVSITAPADRGAVNGPAVAVTATATDDGGVAGVQFRLDGKPLNAEDTSAPYATSWNAGAATAGGHTLTAVARDRAGNEATSTAISVVVDKVAPKVSMTAPRNRATVVGSAVAVTATASDDIGVAGVEFLLDGLSIGPADTIAPYATTWNSTTSLNGTHTLAAVARDGAGNTTKSSVFSVTVDNPAPTGSRKIAAAGDIACAPDDPSFNGGFGTSGACRQMATSDLLIGKGYTDVLTLGDEQYECATATDFAGSFHPSWGRVKPIIHPAAGNHEYKCDSSAGGYFGYFGGAAGPPDKGYYSYDVGSWHVIALNTNNASSTGCPVVSCSAGSAQETWLRADLAANPAPCTIAIWHHPLYSSKPAGVSAASRPFWNALYAAGAEIVLNGHVHNYERFSPQTPDGTAHPNGIAQFVVGTGGVNLESAGTPIANSAAAAQRFGVLELTLNASSYSWRFVTAAGQSAASDSGSANCH